MALKPTLTAPPPPPQAGDDRDTFKTAAAAFVGWQVNSAAEMQQALDYTEEALSEIEGVAESAAKAEQWAENPEDTPVETGQFSALHHSAKAAASAAQAALYDGPKVDEFSELATLTAADLAVGDYVRVIATGGVYQRVASGGHLDYTGSGGVIFSETRGQTPDVYVDATSGDDADHGRAPDAPVQTLARAQGIALAQGDGAIVWLKAGEEWRETLDLSTIAATVRYWGDVSTLGLPFVRGDDAISSGVWQDSTDRADANTNVYSLAATDYDISTGQAAIPPHVYEDGTIMTWAASLAICQSTPGSFYHDGSFSSVSGVTVYIHPTGSGDPASNGREYSYSARDWCVRVGEGGAIIGVKAANSAHDNGPINSSDTVTIDGCFAYGQPLHPILTGGGVQRNSIAWVDKIDGRHAGGYLFEFFNVEGGKSGLWENCMAIAPAGYLGDGFGGHTSAVLADPDSDRFTSIRMVGCYAINCGINFDDLVDGETRGVYSQNGRFRIVSGSATGVVKHIDPYVVRTTNVAGNLIDGGALSTSGGGQVQIEGLRAYCSGTFDQPALGGYDVKIRNSVIVVEPDDTEQTVNFFRNTSGSFKRLDARGCDFELRGYGTARFLYASTAASTSLAMDQMSYAGDFEVIYNGSTYTDLASWQAAEGTDDLSQALVQAEGTDLVGLTTGLFKGTNWTENGDGTWDEDGTGTNTGTARLQFIANTVPREMVFRFTSSGPGMLNVIDGTTAIESDLSAGTHEIKRVWTGNVSVRPAAASSGANTVSAVELRDLAPLATRAVSPSEGDFAVIGEPSTARVGLRRHGDWGLDFLPQTRAEAEGWVIRQLLSRA